MGMEKTGPKAKGASGPSGLLMSRKIPAQPEEKGARKRTGGDASPQQGGIKQKKRKAREPTAPLPPAPPTEYVPRDVVMDMASPANLCLSWAQPPPQSRRLRPLSLRRLRPVAPLSPNVGLWVSLWVIQVI